MTTAVQNISSALRVGTRLPMRRFPPELPRSKPAAFQAGRIRRRSQSKPAAIEAVRRQGRYLAAGFSIRYSDLSVRRYNDRPTAAGLAITAPSSLLVASTFSVLPGASTNMSPSRLPT